MLRYLAAAFCAALVAFAAPSRAQTAGYELISRGDGGLELRFHHMKLRDVRADESQNALAIDFRDKVDGTPFDRLAAEFPDWIAIAYANFDNGVIRAQRPAAFLTRPEDDGFSLRIVPRRPLSLRGQLDDRTPHAPLPPPPAPRAADR